MMSRQDYERIAQAISDVYAEVEYPNCDHVAGETVAAVADRIADQLAADNPNFNAERFLRACGV